MTSFVRRLAMLLSLAFAYIAFAGDAPQPTKDAQKQPAGEQRAKKKKKTKKKDRPREALPAPKEPVADKKPNDDAPPKPDAVLNPAKSKPESKPAQKSKWSATNAADAGEDFLYQGEYMGTVTRDPLDSNRAGLQVIALGDGSFDANLLRGGLPGAGWDRRMKEKLSGKRENGRLLLKNEHWQVLVEPQRATLQQPDGETWGVIPKYHRISATQDAAPWSGATVLFDGRGTSHFEKASVTADGLLSVGAITKQPVRDFHLHLEFRTPFMPYAREQGRGNSGIYIQQRYEVQILDSFGLEGVENECGGLYKQKAPSLNMCLPPLSWQTYDITFTAARFDSAGKKISSAQITVLHNGEPVHWQYALKDKTGGGKVEGPADLPILFQDHGNPVTFRNVWIVPSGAGVPTSPHLQYGSGYGLEAAAPARIGD